MPEPAATATEPSVLVAGSAPPLAHAPDRVGLTSAEVADRTRRGLTNAYQARTSRTYREIIRANVLSVFNITLVVLIVILGALGQVGDSFFAGAAVLVNTLVGLTQEVRAKRAMDRIAQLAAGKVTVRRDGRVVALAPEAIVVDDLIEVAPGDRIVVDGPCAWADALEVDESLITGESDSISKETDDRLTSGSFVTAGLGIMRADKVGAETFVNGLGRTASTMKLELTPIQRKIDAVFSISVVLMVLFAPLQYLADTLREIPLAERLKDTIVLITTFVPQGVVLATTIALTFAAVKITRQRTLVQRINAIESMGNVTVLCFDKTGTLTQNVLSVLEVRPLGGRAEADVRIELARYLASLAVQNKTAAAVGLAVGPAVEGGPAKSSEISFTSARKWGAMAFADGSIRYFGAPEMIVQDELVRGVGIGIARRGLRVLAFVGASGPDAAAALADGRVPAHTEPIGLVILQDRVRSDIRETLASLAARRIQLKVISGDNLETVSSIAAEAGMDVSAGFTGAQLEAMQPAEFGAAVAGGSVFARISPDLKRRIIETLESQGAYTAMVGDGVNDVPALKRARLGIAMYDGSQMAKDVADIVLLDNALTTLPAAIAEGTRTTQKIFATVRMFLTKNFYMVLMFIMVGYIGLPFPGDVRQLSWVTLVVTGVPTALVAFGLVRPRPVWKFARQVLGYIVIRGTIGGVLLTAAFTYAYLTGPHDLEQARSALAVAASLYGALVVWDVHGVVPFEPRTFLQNRREALMGVLVALAAIFIPFFLPGLFRFERLTYDQIAVVILLVVTAAFMFWRASFEQLRLLEPFRALGEDG